ncbi:BZ3500_MvSof-1268-A1-R1_Chr6-3g08763 [Microbotryum saponariae]|uniref:BZ3500_MvSof-1268-A1-R1_Chr6-3g08763 protein n=1 Tax=Microbotryum saponariae TaxID=289078 RepID=A0A2X0LJX0_9BASI|nr:BZ3500_MvSof-1268-A1-R1_Chr6-3g08763 [Microbotryum saponariae]SDA07364.1 BZ3501_MvSof-1269-A2-R1_Chr6-2g08466 [Microbotryum saponariae]
MAAAQMTPEFRAYEGEYDAVKQSVQGKIDEDVAQQRGEQRKATIRRINMELEEADEIIEQMEMEARGKAALMIKVRQYKGEVKTFRSKVVRQRLMSQGRDLSRSNSYPAAALAPSSQTALSAISDRDLLLSQPAHSAYTIDVDDDEIAGVSSSQAQRSRLLQSTQTLNKSGDRLTNSQRLAAESEEMGGSILSSLRMQRGQLESANEELEQADGSIAKASVTLKKMVRLAYRQRIMLIGFGIALMILIVLILWHKLK